MDNEISEETRAAAYGELYASSVARINAIKAAIDEQAGIGFDSVEACAEWAKEHLLDKVAYLKSSKNFHYVSYSGELLTKGAFHDYFSVDLLFTWKLDGDGERTKKRVSWLPVGTKYMEQAKIAGERSDGIREPLNHRDYFTTTGAYSDERGTFNNAKPFPAFAKETGADTRHIVQYLKAISGKCYDYLMTWLKFKCMYPTQKTEVVPVMASRVQGNGKTTFAQVICKGLFGEDNVLVTDQYDANARFNSDYADALIICAEEQEEDDKRATTAAIKSRSTGKTIRKELKGVDPVYQDNYGEYIITTNRDVPVKFEGVEDQRRFMIMDSDPNFVAKTNPEAAKVFAKLYGLDSEGGSIGTPFTEDINLISQFKHELFNNINFAQVKLRDFPKDTDAYLRSKNLPRTNEAVEIQSILHSLAPFIKQSLLEGRIVTQVTDLQGQSLGLQGLIQIPDALQYMEIGSFGVPAYVAMCLPLVFYDQDTGKPFKHSVVSRGLLDSRKWMLEQYGIEILADQSELAGGFKKIQNRHRSSPAGRFALAVNEVVVANEVPQPENIVILEERNGKRLRVNSRWVPDPNGEFETVNEMLPGVETLANKNSNVAYLDTFLFEADDTTKNNYGLEKSRLVGTTIKQAESVFTERLRLQKFEADRLLDAGIAFRVVYSGAKSYHILVRLEDSPQNIDEYRWLHAHLANGILSNKLDFDASTNDPARLTRAPITKERTTMYDGSNIVGIQRLYREKPGQVFGYRWRHIYEEWKNRPLGQFELKGKKLRPYKKEYTEAAHALLEGTFWTDSTWNGRRQQCFFPAYRLCRLLGFDHDQLWGSGGILDGLERYYRQRDRQYWESREDSPIIKEIDGEVEAEWMSE
jgi:hypothetical protein